jgi:hypothetical protein
MFIDYSADLLIRFWRQTNRPIVNHLDHNCFQWHCKMIAKLHHFWPLLFGLGAIHLFPPVVGQAQTSEQGFPVSTMSLVLPSDPFDNRSPKPPAPVFRAPELTPWTNQPSGHEFVSPLQPPFNNDDELLFRNKPTASDSESTDPQKVSLKDSVKIPLAGSIFLFGQAKKEDSGNGPEPKITGGQTGLGFGLPLDKDVEVSFRCGTAVTAKGSRTDPTSDRSGLPFSSQLLRLEVQGRWLVMGPFHLEWVGAASPATTALEHDIFEHDLRLVLPLGQIGQLQMGTKHFWESKPDSKLWNENGQLYGGFQLKW